MSESKVEYTADYEWAVELNRCSMRVIGLWPEEERSGRKKFLAKLHHTVVLLMIIFGCTIPCFCSLIRHCDDLMAVMDNLGYSVPFLITSMKYIVVCGKKEVLLPIVNMVAEDWAKLKTDLERDVMMQRIRVARTVNILGYTLILTVITLLMVLPRIGISVRYVTNETDVKKIFPLPSYYIYDVSQSPYFEITLLVQIVGIVLGALCYVSVDNFFGMLILHICGQLENLRTRLANTKQLETFDRILVTTVEDHIRLIRTVDAIESTFTLLALALLLYFGTFSCIYGLLLLTIIIQKEEFSLLRVIYLMCIFLNTLLQTSLYCIAGQILASQSEGVYDAAYECEWLNLKPSKAKGLILIMARAKRPLYLTAGKLIPMTMPTLCNILRISFSYASVLLTKLW